MVDAMSESGLPKYEVADGACSGLFGTACPSKLFVRIWLSLLRFIGGSASPGAGEAGDGMVKDLCGLSGRCTVQGVPLGALACWPAARSDGFTGGHCIPPAADVRRACPLVLPDRLTADIDNRCAEYRFEPAPPCTDGSMSPGPYTFAEVVASVNGRETTE